MTVSTQYSNTFKSILEDGTHLHRLEICGFDSVIQNKQNLITSFNTAFENDNLEDFYLEFWDEILALNIPKQIAHCSLSDPIGSTDFELFTLASKNLIFARIIASGNCEDYAPNEFFHTWPCEKEFDISSMFKEFCLNVYTCDGEFTEKQAKKNGSEMSFTI